MCNFFLAVLMQRLKHLRYALPDPPCTDFELLHNFSPRRLWGRSAIFQVNNAFKSPASNPEAQRVDAVLSSSSYLIEAWKLGHMWIRRTYTKHVRYGLSFACFLSTFFLTRVLPRHKSFAAKRRLISWCLKGPSSTSCRSLFGTTCRMSGWNLTMTLGAQQLLKRLVSIGSKWDRLSSPKRSFKSVFSFSIQRKANWSQRFLWGRFILCGPDVAGCSAGRSQQEGRGFVRKTQKYPMEMSFCVSLLGCSV